MSNFELAQLNIAYLKAPIDSPVPRGFCRQSRPYQSAGRRFGWVSVRLQSDEGNATSLRPFGDDVIVNMSVWRDLDALRKFVYHSAHTEIMRRRREWFAHPPQAYAVLCGYRPVIGRVA